MTPPPHTPGGESGFALTETLVASAIIAAMLGLTYQAIQTTVHSTLVLQDQRRAWPVAESIMARVGADIALAPGVLDGTTDGEAWRVEIAPYADSSERAVDGPALLDVEVTVRPVERDRPKFTLRSLRLGL